MWRTEQQLETYQFDTSQSHLGEPRCASVAKARQCNERVLSPSDALALAESCKLMHDAEEGGVSWCTDGGVACAGMEPWTAHVREDEEDNLCEALHFFNAETGVWHAHWDMEQLPQGVYYEGLDEHGIPRVCVDWLEICWEERHGCPQ